MASKFGFILMFLFVFGCATHRPEPSSDQSGTNNMVSFQQKPTASAYVLVRQSNHQSPSLQTTGARKALVIGNGDYGDFKLASLSKPVSDATAMYKKLQDYGFIVTLVTNADRDKFRSTIATFTSSLQAGDEALFFYAGHGISLTCPQKSNTLDQYLVPVGQKINNSNDLCEHGISIEWLRRGFIAQGTSTNILLLDTCRDSSIESYSYDGTFPIASSATPLPASDATTLVVYATSLGETAHSHKERVHSFFTQALLDALVPGTDNKPIGLWFPEKVRSSVERTTAELDLNQKPSLVVSSGDNIANFCFRPPCSYTASPADNDNDRPLSIDFSEAQKFFDQLPLLSDCATIGDTLNLQNKIINGSGFWARSGIDNAIGVCQRNSSGWAVNSLPTSGTKFYLVKKV